MDAQLPRVAEGLDLLDLAGDVLELAVLDVALAGRRLPVRSELDAIRRVEVDHLHLAPEALALGQAGHHLERIAEDHAVRPVGLVLVELDQVQLAQPVERLEQGQLGLGLAAPAVRRRFSTSTRGSIFSWM